MVRAKKNKKRKKLLCLSVKSDNEMSYLLLCTVDDSDSYISEGEVERVEDAPLPEAVAELAELVKPTVPLGADFGTYE